jgi:hypothetical protein
VGGNNDSAVAAPFGREKKYDFSDLSEAIERAFKSCTVNFPEPLKIFRTDLTGSDELNDIYLNNLPLYRQEHTCSACRNFLRNYAGLVTVDSQRAGRSIRLRIYAVQ